MVKVLPPRQKESGLDKFLKVVRAGTGIARTGVDIAQGIEGIKSSQLQRDIVERKQAKEEAVNELHAKWAAQKDRNVEMGLSPGLPSLDQGDELFQDPSQGISQFAQDLRDMPLDPESPTTQLTALTAENIFDRAQILEPGSPWLASPPRIRDFEAGPRRERVYELVSEATGISIETLKENPDMLVTDVLPEVGLKMIDSQGMEYLLSNPNHMRAAASWAAGKAAGFEGTIQELWLRHVRGRSMQDYVAQEIAEGNGGQLARAWLEQQFGDGFTGGEYTISTDDLPFETGLPTGSQVRIRISDDEWGQIVAGTWRAGLEYALGNREAAVAMQEKEYWRRAGALFEENPGLFENINNAYLVASGRIDDPNFLAQLSPAQREGMQSLLDIRQQFKTVEWNALLNSLLENNPIRGRTENMYKLWGQLGANLGDDSFDIRNVEDWRLLVDQMNGANAAAREKGLPEPYPPDLTGEEDRKMRGWFHTTLSAIGYGLTRGGPGAAGVGAAVSSSPETTPIAGPPQPPPSANPQVGSAPQIGHRPAGSDAELKAMKEELEQVSAYYASALEGSEAKEYYGRQMRILRSLIDMREGRIPYPDDTSSVTPEQ